MFIALKSCPSTLPHLLLSATRATTRGPLRCSLVTPHPRSCLQARLCSHRLIFGPGRLPRTPRPVRLATWPLGMTSTIACRQHAVDPAPPHLPAGLPAGLLAATTPRQQVEYHGARDTAHLACSGDARLPPVAIRRYAGTIQAVAAPCLGQTGLTQPPPSPARPMPLL